MVCGVGEMGYLDVLVVCNGFSDVVFDMRFENLFSEFEVIYFLVFWV